MTKFKYNEGDYVGAGFLLIERIKPIHNHKGYLCSFKCPKCGKIFETDLYSLTGKYSKTISCGCYREKYVQFQSKDLTGKRFGHLTVLGKSDKEEPHPNGGRFYFWECICDCGEKTIVSTSHLTTGHTTSCGKCCISKGEDKIKKILQENLIKFEQQKRFSDCKDKNTLPFDFYLPDYNCCIEYDGKQHFFVPGNKKSTIFTEEKIKEIQRHDKIKTQYCKDNDINLIRIPYFDFDKITIDFLKKLIYN